MNRIESVKIQFRATVKNIYEYLRESEPKENEFVGWLVKQRYKVKTGGGLPVFSDDIFVFNEDVTDCLFHATVEEYEGICNFINQIKALPEEELMNRIDNLHLTLAPI